jgi:hypothetical protein
VNFHGNEVKNKKKRFEQPTFFCLQVGSQSGSAARPTRYMKSLVTFSTYSGNVMEKILSELIGARLVKTFTAFNGTPMLCSVLKRTCLVT